MKVREVSGTEPYELSPHGHAFINPYGGCTMGCPFLFLVKQGRLGKKYGDTAENAGAARKKP